jgi:hypothetical protein
VQYDENELKRQMKAQMDEAIKSDRMKPSEAMRLLDDYERGLKAYTYLSLVSAKSYPALLPPGDGVTTGELWNEGRME